MKRVCTGLAAAAFALNAMAVPEDRFLGGPFDGSAVAYLIQYDAGSAGALNSDRFKGGGYDGYAMSALTAYDRDSAGAWRSDRFRGGPRDGYAMVAVVTYDRVASPQWNSARFSGGANDGYAMVERRTYDRVTSPQWNSVRFSGGPRDGSDRAVMTGIPNPLNGDLDADGLPDWWEALYYGSIYATDADGDTDVDGVSAWGEYVSGTSPTNGASVLQWLEFSLDVLSNDWKILRWSSASGRVYSISVVTDILKNASAPLVTNLTATPPDNVWTNTAAGALFEVYRVEAGW